MRYQYPFVKKQPSPNYPYQFSLARFSQLPPHYCSLPADSYAYRRYEEDGNGGRFGLVLGVQSSS